MQDFKVAPRIKDPVLLRLLKFELLECEVTGETFNLHLHHVIYKSHGGDDVRGNIICLAESVHTAYHAGNYEAKLLIGTHIDTKRPDVARYLHDKLGGADALLEWFARHGLSAHEERSTNV